MPPRPGRSESATKPGKPKPSGLVISRSLWSSSQKYVSRSAWNWSRPKNPFQSASPVIGSVQVGWSGQKSGHVSGVVESAGRSFSSGRPVSSSMNWSAAKPGLASNPQNTFCPPGGPSAPARGPRVVTVLRTRVSATPSLSVSTGTSTATTGRTSPM